MSAARSTAERRRSARADRGDPCPLCGADSRFAFLATDRNRRITSETFRYHRCSACATVFMVDVPEDLTAYYAADYHRFDARGEPEWRNTPSHLMAEGWRVDALRLLVQPGALIDVGAGAGGFAAAAHERGFEVTAIEMDPRCCDYISSTLGVRAICSDEPQEALEALPCTRVVTLWHVLEHLREPGAMLGAAVRALEPGGVLALGVPNPESIQARLLRGHWAHLDAPRHVCLMPAAAIRRKTAELGLQFVRQTTSDPSGQACNAHGWVYALRRDPSRGPATGAALRAGGWLTMLLGPAERRRNRGAALTMFLRKPGG